MLANRPQDTELHTLAERLLKIASAHREMFAKLTHTGHYSHEYCVSFDITLDDADDVAYAAIETDFTEICRALMRHLYAQLEEDYNAQMEDETIAENIRANGYEFTGEGTRYG